MTPIETFQHEGFTVEIHYDDEPCNNPRECDNLSIILAWHRRSDLGDKGFNSRDIPAEVHGDLDATIKWLETEHGARNIIPLYIYEHSGQTIQASKTGNPFRCPWDSGQVGFVFTNAERIEVCGTSDEHIDEALVAEVKAFDSYLRGEVYGYVVLDEEGEHVDSCWGYVGDAKYCRQEAKSAAEFAARQAAAESVEAAEWAARDTVTV